ncbi:MAG: inositol monophosphatase [Bdellovibrionales bacterium]
MNLSKLLPQVEQIALDAGEILKKYFKDLSDTDFQVKSDQSLVTVADKASEDFIRKELHRVAPDIGFIGEETFTDQALEGWNWVVDPLDGTNNFIHKMDHFAVSIGLMLDTSSKLGVVFSPLKKELYSAFEGGGAFFNKQQLPPLRIRPTGQSNVIVGRYFSNSSDLVPLEEERLKNSYAYLERFNSVRSLGAAALDACYVAQGKADLFFQRGLSIWDCAASMAILREQNVFIKNCRNENYTPLKNKEFICSLDPEKIRDLCKILCG